MAQVKAGRGWGGGDSGKGAFVAALAGSAAGHFRLPERPSRCARGQDRVRPAPTADQLGDDADDDRT